MLQDAAPKLEPESTDVSATPPLTPASITFSPTVDTFAESGQTTGNRSFSVSSYFDGGGCASTGGSSSSSGGSSSSSGSMGASCSEDSKETMLILQHVRLALVIFCAWF